MRSGAISGRRLAPLFERVTSWYRGYRDRRLLAGMDDRMLRDIGIDRATAGSDRTTCFWRLR